MFANDEMICVSWTFTAEERVPSLRHTNVVIGAYVTEVGEYTCIGNLIDCKKMRFIVTQILLYIYPGERRTTAG